MFFTASPEEGKHHLRLSEHAMLCITSDRETFSSSETPLSLAGFLNRVFTNYFRLAKASVALQCAARLRERQTQREMYAAEHSLSADELEQLRRYDEALCRAEAQQQAGQILRSLKQAKGHTQKVRINKQNMEYLYGSASQCAEEEYYDGRAGLYLRAVLEEYCRLEYSQRERVYFPLPSVWYGKTVLEIRSVYGHTDLVYLYDVQAQALAPYNYLLGACFRHTEQGDCWQPYLLRLSAVQECREVPLPQNVVPPGENLRRQCFAQAKERGLSYLYYPCQEVRVRLTKPEGIRLYRRILWYRPMMRTVESEDDTSMICRFYCPPLQARAYFMRFGAQAQVLSPDELRQDLALFFTDAAAQYNTHTTI